MRVSVDAPVASRPTRRLTIAGCIASLGSGGAERVMTLLANEWAARGHTVSLTTLDDAPPFYPVDPQVRLNRLGLASDRGGSLARPARVAARLAGLRRAIRAARPDVCVSFIDRLNVQVLAATRRLGVPVIVSERVHPGFVDPPGWGTVRRLAYRVADAVVVQTDETARCFGGLPGLVRTIANPVRSVSSTGASRARHVVAAGRLVPQKGFDLLIRAFAQVAPDRPEWRLTIYGEGPERGRLEALVARYRLGAQVSLPGTTKELPARLAEASVFVLSSRFEGFPNALLEAMATGLAVVSTRCPAGPSELIRDGVDGRLVPVDDERALADALTALMEDAGLRRAYADAAVAVRERYAVGRVADRWLALAREVA